MKPNSNLMATILAMLAALNYLPLAADESSLFQQIDMEKAALSVLTTDYANDYAAPPFPPVENEALFYLPQWNSALKTEKYLSQTNPRYGIYTMFEFLKQDQQDYYFDLKFVIQGQTYHFRDYLYSGENNIQVLRGHDFVVDISRHKIYKQKSAAGTMLMGNIAYDKTLKNAGQAKSSTNSKAKETLKSDSSKLKMQPAPGKSFAKIMAEKSENIFPMTVQEPTDTAENNRIKKILQNAFQTTRNQQYALAEKNPDHFAPSLIRAEYYHWRDSDGNDYWRTDLFDQAGLKEQYIQNPDGIFGTVGTFSAPMRNTFLLGRPEAMALPLLDKEWEFGRFEMTEETFNGYPCYLIKMRMAEMTPPKALYVFVATYLPPDKREFYPALRTYLVNQTTGQIYSHKRYSANGKLLSKVSFSPMESSPEFSAEFFATPNPLQSEQARMHISLRRLAQKAHDNVIPRRPPPQKASLFLRVFSPRSMQSLPWIVGGLSVILLAGGVFIKIYQRYQK